MPSDFNHELKVKNVKSETPNAVSIFFEVPENLNEKFQYHGGQFLSLFFEVDGEKISRSYSIASCSSLGEDLQVTVKRVSGGKGSNFLCENIKPGDTLEVAPPAGNFLPKNEIHKQGHFHLFAAGSGITPIYSILKTKLNQNLENKIDLYFCNRSIEDTIYFDELKALEQKSPQLKIHWFFTKEPTTGPWQTCRIGKAQLPQDTSVWKSQSAAAFICGPGDFIEKTKQNLLELGLVEAQIFIESFNTQAQASPIQDSKEVQIGEPSEEVQANQLIATIDGEKIEVGISAGQTILEALIENGANPPYSCMDGACMACMAKLDSGRVYQEDPGILTDENIADGEILTCQAKAISGLVQVDFDDI